MTQFAERLRKGREAKGLSKAKFAELMDVEPSAVTRWEKGGGIEEDRIPKIAAILGRSTEWLTGIIDSDVEGRLKELEDKLGQALASTNVPKATAKGSKRDELLALIASVPDSRIPALIGWTNTFINRKSDDVEARPPVKNPSGK